MSKWILYISAIFALSLLSACGQQQPTVPGSSPRYIITPDGSTIQVKEVCFDGVVYLIGTYRMTVKFEYSGNDTPQAARCPKETSK